ncbi:MAG: hypothetical protein DMF63_07340 [Acidobacteria bacterium]|nr:MAG: hypothetical protein DMF63_07340 [Acidobacteriota bacterium]
MKHRIQLLVLGIMVVACCCAENAMHRATKAGSLNAIDGGGEPSNSRSVTAINILGANSLKLAYLDSFGDKLLATGSSTLSPMANLFQSSDGGRTWQQIPLPKVKGLEPGVRLFQGTNSGLWVLAGRLLLKNAILEEGSWKIIHRFPGAEPLLFSFLDDNQGYIVQAEQSGCEILKTTNGGKDWRVVYRDSVAGNPFDMVVLDERTVLLAMNNEYVLRTGDGGASWRKEELLPEERVLRPDDWVKQDRTGASDLTVDGNGKVWTAGEKASLFFTNHSGDRWHRLAINVDATQLNFNAIAFSRTGQGVVIGNEGALLLSRSAGLDWAPADLGQMAPDSGELLKTMQSDNLLGVTFLGETAIILGRDHIYSISF